jgi:hypothetical protein
MKTRSLTACMIAAALWPGVAGAQAVIVDLGPPGEVITYVERYEAPSVWIDDEVTVGYVLPPAVVVRPVPRYPRYGYAIVNDRRVLVAPGSRRVIFVID